MTKSIAGIWHKTFLEHFLDGKNVSNSRIARKNTRLLIIKRKTVTFVVHDLIPSNGEISSFSKTCFFCKNLQKCHSYSEKDVILPSHVRPFRL